MESPEKKQTPSTRIPSRQPPATGKNTVPPTAPPQQQTKPPTPIANALTRLILRIATTATVARYSRDYSNITIITDHNIKPLHPRYAKGTTITYRKHKDPPATHQGLIIYATEHQHTQPRQETKDTNKTITITTTRIPTIPRTKAPASTEEKTPPNQKPNKYVSNRGIYSLHSEEIDVTAKISPLLTATILTAYVALISIAGGFIPSDDLARHLKAYQYGYDMANLFIYSFHPPYNTYPLFDHMASALYKTMGMKAATVLQVLPLAITIAAIIRMTKGQDKNAVSMAIVLLFAFTWSRYASARPCVMVSSLFLIAHAHRDDFSPAIHFAAALLMSSLYNLFFLYTIPLMANRRTAAAYAAATAAGLLGWHHYSNGQYFTDLLTLITTNSIYKLGNAAYYSELRPVLSPVLILYMAVLLPFIARFRTDIRRSIATTWFLLLNQIRYMETAVPLMLTYFGGYVRAIPAYFVIASITMALAFIRPQPYDTVKLPTGSIVFTRSSSEMNAVVTATDYARVVPSANIGWNDKAIQKAAIALGQEKTFDCTILSSYHFDYLVEDTMEKQPKCLTYEGSQGKYRIWKTKEEKTVESQPSGKETSQHNPHTIQPPTDGHLETKMAKK